MTTANYPFRSNVTVIGDGECSREVFEEALKFAPNLIAADGGAARALGWGQVPALVVGDMDSLAPDMRGQLPDAAIIAIDEQETTDFDKVLRVISAPLILGVGLLGGRLDHALASLSTLARAAPGRVVLLTDREVCFHVPPALELALPPGAWFSLFPMRRVVVRARGLVWPLDDLALEPVGRIGTSNRVAAGGLVRIEADGPGLLVMVPRAALGEVLARLAQPA
ncbi:MAG TPA: thiamine diphosphokinase [Aliiroseovarius sp.]|nr:thiamine diphosphokinase [Aliiroseovarius sp.]